MNNNAKKILILLLSLVVTLSCMPASIFAEGAPETDEEYLNRALGNYEYGVLAPVYGTDTNAAAFLKRDLERRGFTGIDVGVTSVEAGRTQGGVNITDSGDLTYFFCDPMEIVGAPYYNMPYGYYDVTFNLSYGTASSSLKKRVNLYWDIERLKSALDTKILSNLTWDLIKGANTDQNEVTSNLTLPRYLGGKDGGNTLAEIKWASSNTSSISISDGSDPIYGDYVATVKQDTVDRAVTLTATVDYKKTNDGTKEAEEISKMKKEIVVTVPSVDVEAVKLEMQQKLDDNYLVGKLKDSITDEIIDPSGVTGDIQLLAPRNTGISGYSNYRFTVTSDASDVAVINGYRANIYRPLPGEPDKPFNLVVRMALRENENIYVEKSIPLTAKALTNEELDNARELMDKAVEAYWDGIKGENDAKNNITKDLRSFQEVVLNNEGDAEFIYNNSETTGAGVKPVTYVENTEAGAGDDQYTFFHSSRPTIIQHGFPRLLTTPEYNTDVVIESYLSHSIYEKYYIKYKEAGDTDSAFLFKDLYRRHASVNLVVKGEKGDDPDKDKPINVTFKLIGAKGKLWIPATDLTLRKGATCGEAVERILTEKGYAISGSTAYISGITTPSGEKLSEKDMGDNSGWLYRVNDELAAVTMDMLELKDNDYIVLYYTEDYTKDDGPKEEKPEEVKPIDDPNGKDPGGGKQSGSVTPTDKDSITPSDEAANKAPVSKSIKKIPLSGITTSARIGKKTMTIKFDKAKGATNYRVAYRKAGSSKWDYAWTGGKNSYVMTKMKTNGLYQFKLAAYKKTASGWQRGSWSGTSYRYYAASKSKISAGKSRIKVKLKKRSGASGYEILYGTKSSLKGAKTKAVKGKKARTIYVKGLKKGKKYYAAVRPYKMYKGKKYVGITSGKKLVRVK